MLQVRQQNFSHASVPHASASYSFIPTANLYGSSSASVQDYAKQRQQPPIMLDNRFSACGIAGPPSGQQQLLEASVHAYSAQELNYTQQQQPMQTYNNGAYSAHQPFDRHSSIPQQRSYGSTPVQEYSAQWAEYYQQMDIYQQAMEEQRKNQ
uniref:Uncharacterized protein n=1 Tax=Panagrolaimus sp. ES5 TaxID=591445 RepID=A0AC34G3R6_9BILA